MQKKTISEEIARGIASESVKRIQDSLSSSDLEMRFPGVSQELGRYLLDMEHDVILGVRKYFTIMEE